MTPQKIGPCQCCGEVTMLFCAPSRFGNETWACVDCWNPGDGPAPNHNRVIPPVTPDQIRAIEAMVAPEFEDGGWVVVEEEITRPQS